MRTLALCVSAICSIILHLKTIMHISVLAYAQEVLRDFHIPPCLLTHTRDLYARTSGNPHYSPLGYDTIIISKLMSAAAVPEWKYTFHGDEYKIKM